MRGWGIKIAAFFQDLTKVENEARRRTFLIYFFSFVALIALLFYAIRGWILGKGVYTVIVLIFFGLTVLNLLLFYLGGSIRRAAYGIVFLMLILNLFLFAFLGEGQSGILWYYVLPPLAIMLFGIRRGTAYSLLLLVITLVIWWLKPKWLVNQYESNFILRLVTTYLVEIFLINIFEYSRRAAHLAYLRQLKELTTMEEELKQNYEELQATNEQLIMQRRVIERKNKELRKYMFAIEQSKIAIIFSDTRGRINYINPAVTELTGYERSEVIGQSLFVLASEFVSAKIFQAFLKMMARGHTWRKQLVLRKKDGKLFFAFVVVSPIKDEHGEIFSYMVMMYNITREKILTMYLRRQHKELKRLYQNLTDSIQYAKVIQDRLIKPDAQALRFFSEYFIIFKPKHILSGDFYYIAMYQDFIIIALSDSTGHGVPAAFISVLGYSFLQDIIRYRGYIEPDKILTCLRDEFIKIFDEYFIGMDVALCIINKKTKLLQFSGANRSLILIRNQEQMIELKGVKTPVGNYLVKKQYPLHELSLQPGDVFYLFTDGFYDQIGQDTQGRLVKFYSRNFKRLLLEICSLDLATQKQVLLEAFEQWKGSQRQTDDVTILGFKV